MKVQVAEESYYKYLGTIVDDAWTWVAALKDIKRKMTTCKGLPNFFGGGSHGAGGEV